MGLTNADRGPAVDRTIAALNLVAHEDHLTVADLTRQLGVAKSSASDLVKSMVGERLLARQGRRLVLGELVPRIASGYAGNSRVLRRFAMAWDKYPILTQHTLSLQALIGLEVIYLDVRLGRHVLPHTPRAGIRVPALRDGVAAPMLQYIPPARVGQALDRFAGFQGNPDLAEQVRQWSASHYSGRDASAVVEPTPTGNDVLTAIVPTDSEQAAPISMAIHLPPNTPEPNAAELIDSLRKLASSLAR